MQRLVVLIIAVALASGTMVTGACLTRARTKPEPFTIVWNYDTSTYLETCGCSAHQLGGLERRATLIARLREKQPLVAIEGAHVVQMLGEFQLFKGEMLLNILTLLDYDAVMLGVREAQHGIEGIARLRQAAGCPCFSANLVLDDQAQDPLPAFVRIEIAGIHLGITGVSQPQAANFELPAGVHFTDPADALADVLPVLERDCDLIVLCLEGEATWIARMVERYRDRCDLFLSGDRHKTTAGLEFIPGPPRLNNWELGKRLGVINVDPLPEGFSISGTNIDIGDDIEVAAEITDYLDDTYRPQLKERFFSKMKQDLEQIYLPPKICRGCHDEACAVYEASDHRRAMNSLAEVNQLYSPDCMPCHVVYDPDTDELHSINCIACHSNITEDHIWDAVAEKVVPPAEPVTSYTYECCSECHDALNSVPFREHWPQYAKRIYHGGDMAAAEEAAERMGLDIDGEIPE